eukprot:g28700.t1
MEDERLSALRGGSRTALDVDTEAEDSEVSVELTDSGRTAGAARVAAAARAWAAASAPQSRLIGVSSRDLLGLAPLLCSKAAGSEMQVVAVMMNQQELPPTARGAPERTPAQILQDLRQQGPVHRHGETREAFSTLRTWTSRRPRRMRTALLLSLASSAPLLDESNVLSIFQHAPGYRCRTRMFSAPTNPAESVPMLERMAHAAHWCARHPGCFGVQIYDGGEEERCSARRVPEDRRVALEPFGV